MTTKFIRNTISMKLLSTVSFTKGHINANVRPAYPCGLETAGSQDWAAGGSE
jgi:hypothetical protein